MNRGFGAPVSHDWGTEKTSDWEYGLIADVYVSQLEVPTSLNLLPGQTHMLREAVDKELERLKDITEKAASARASKAEATPDPDNYLSVPSEMPA